MVTLNFPILYENSNPSELCDNRRGVYCWLNKTNGKKYVGIAASSEGFRSRILTHCRVEKRSGAILLQAALKKYGLDNFVVYELADLSNAEPAVFAVFEQTLIKTLNSQAPNGYNLTAGGSGTLGYSNLSANSKKRGIVRPEVSEALAKRAELVSPDGVVYYVKNLSAFAVAQGFSPSAFYKLASHEAESYKGWKLKTQTRESYARRNSKVVFLVSPEGEVVKILNISKFAKANNLAQAALNGVWLKRKSYHACKGWTRATEEQIKNFDVSASRYWDFDKWVMPCLLENQTAQINNNEINSIDKENYD